MATRRPKPPQSGLATLANIGPAMLKDFETLGIDSVEALARQDADAMYLKIAELTGYRHDPCVWDTYHAAIHEAKTGEKTTWWSWTPERKQRQAAGTFI